MKVAAVFCALLSVAAAFQPMPVRMTAPRIVMSAKRSAPARMPVAPMAAALPIASLVAAAPADAMPLDGSSVDVSLTAFQVRILERVRVGGAPFGALPPGPVCGETEHSAKSATE
jgi:hypothetical protein